MQIGTRVRFNGNEAYKVYKSSGFYPPDGTLGTVKDIDARRKDLLVAWDSGTISPGIWWCGEGHVEIVEEEE